MSQWEMLASICTFMPTIFETCFEHILFLVKLRTKSQPIDKHMENFVNHQLVNYNINY